MKNYFYKTIFRCFSNAVFARYGSVAITLYKDEAKSLIRFVVYDIPKSKLDELPEDKHVNHIQIDNSYSIHDVDFNDDISVSQKIIDLSTAFEIEVYSS
ncbi:hypothetical protein JUJ52_08755 [Virgibacillus sp. AGTR]|uniref:hypothetical protein n=1 Tax=Virgibacillus sp. AGTR TaxID=2812055 RepID=UPI001D163523|nr:hypothetical protein [Virgibacillus sp. AGTR]MCC2250055.1 hypothetical protein [Virgibacillus sp. AGTR]